MRRFDPKPHLDLADELAAEDSQENPPGEIKLRTAVGRAYYGVFLVAREITGVIEQNGVHSAVVHHIRRRYGFLVGENLSRLKDLREMADYEFPVTNQNFSDWGRNWSTAKMRAEQILEKLRTRR